MEMCKVSWFYMARTKQITQN